MAISGKYGPFDILKIGGVNEKRNRRWFKLEKKFKTFSIKLAFSPGMVSAGQGPVDTCALKTLSSVRKGTKVNSL